MTVPEGGTSPFTEQLEALRAPFPAEKIGKLPRAIGRKEERSKGNCDVCGKYHDKPAIHIDYVGHAEVTERLLEVDPFWYWEPYTNPEANMHGIEYRNDGYPLRMWIKLHVLGMERIGVGTIEDGKNDPEKQLIGDAIRNAAMRFGVALELWSKAERGDTEVSANEPEKLDDTTREALIEYLGTQDDTTRRHFGKTFGKRSEWSPLQLPKMIEWTEKQCTAPFDPPAV